MRDEQLQSLIGLVIESDDLAAGVISTNVGTKCLTLSRLEQIAVNKSPVSNRERAHLAGCGICPARLRGFAPAPAALRSIRRLGARERRWIGLGLGAAAAGLAWMVAPTAPMPVGSGAVARGSRPPVTMAGSNFELAGTELVKKAGECLRCDADCDGIVTPLDLCAFLIVLASPDAYTLEFPDCDVLCTLDLNCDGAIDDDDIEPTVLTCVHGG